MRDALREAIERELVVETTGWAGERAARVTERLQPGVAAEDRLESLVVWWSDHNAFTTYGRTIYLSRRLFERMPDDDAAAFVIAHELAHHKLGHIPPFVPVRLVSARLILNALARTIASAARERDADLLAIELCIAAGYDPEKCVVALEQLAQVALDYGDVDGVVGGNRRRSHPALHDRIASVRAHVASGGRLDIRATIARDRERRRKRMLAIAGGVAATGIALLVLGRRPR